MTLQLALAFFAGVPIGFQLGLTGTGGGLLAIPLLVYVVGVNVQQAVAMSLVIIAVSTALGAYEYGRLGQVKVKAALAFSWSGFIGAWLGAYGHQWIPEEVLLILFGILLLLSRMLIIQRSQALGDGGVNTEGTCAAEFPGLCWVKAAVVGFAVGLLNGFFGVGGGFMIVTALVLLLDFPSRLAAGTSLLTIAVISLGGIAGHAHFGALDLRLTGIVVLGSALGILLGAQSWQRASPKVMGLVSASVTVGVAVGLIIVNAVKLLGVHL
jgi:uncharacterized membrane protein YfcA